MAGVGAGRRGLHWGRAVRTPAGAAAHGGCRSIPWGWRRDPQRSLSEGRQGRARAGPAE